LSIGVDREARKDRPFPEFLMNDRSSDSRIPSLHLADPADVPARFLRVDAAGVFDAFGVAFSPGSILLELTKPQHDEIPGLRRAVGAKVLAVGSPGDVDCHPAASSDDLDVIRRLRSVIIPGLVNAHTHLDLTHIGPVPHDPDGGFMTFIEKVRSGRRPDGDGLAQAVDLGIDLSIRGGVVVVGDIAGAPAGFPALTPYQTLAGSGLAGVSFLEFFGIGKGEAPGLERLEGALQVWSLHGGTNEGRAVRLGLQPHAPYSVSIDAYLRAAELAGRHLPLCTHLAETAEESEFVAQATGRQRQFLERVGVWDDVVLRHVGNGRRPVDHLMPVLRKAPFLCVHLNDLNDREIEGLAQANATAVYCPRASEYFRAVEAFGPHRYRDLIKAGVPVALGTDSIMGLPTGAESERLSTWDEMRVLFKRDGVDARTLLAMATLHGARVLGLSDAWVRLGVGNTPRGLVAVDVGAAKSGTMLEAALGGVSGPEPIVVVRNQQCV
jgi:cytosine/adenosine deaminase-related metal-dependent hydrolase